jgi:hypothetical protein
MKVQITRFSPHQNAKVFALLMAIASLAFAVPMFLAFSLMPAGVDARGNALPSPPIFMPLLFPLAYLVMGYVMVRIGCWLYNIMFKHVGGIEYEVRESDDA